MSRAGVVLQKVEGPLFATHRLYTAPHTCLTYIRRYTPKEKLFRGWVVAVSLCDIHITAPESDDLHNRPKTDCWSFGSNICALRPNIGLRISSSNFVLLYSCVFLSVLSKLMDGRFWAPNFYRELSRHWTSSTLWVDCSDLIIHDSTAYDKNSPLFGHEHRLPFVHI